MSNIYYILPKIFQKCRKIPFPHIFLENLSNVFFKGILKSLGNMFFEIQRKYSVVCTA